MKKTCFLAIVAIGFTGSAQAATAPSGRMAACASPVAIDRIKKSLRDQMHADFAGIPDRFRPHAFKIFDTAIVKVDQIDTVASSQNNKICQARLSIHYTDEALLSYHKVNVLLSQIRMSEAASVFSLVEKDALVRLAYTTGMGSLAGTEDILFDKGILTEIIKFQIRTGTPASSNVIPPNFDGMAAISRVLSFARAGVVAKNMTPNQRSLENQRYSETSTETQSKLSGRTNFNQVMGEAKNALYTAYEYALNDDPTMIGDVVVRVSVSPSGLVSDVALISSELNNSSLETRLLSLIRKLDFKSGNYNFFQGQYTYSFSPARGRETDQQNWSISDVRIEASPEHLKVIEDRVPTHAPPTARYPGSEFGLIPEDPRPVSERQ